MRLPILSVVDDDPGMSALLKDIAQGLGYHVRVYRDGLSFIDAFDYKVEVIVLDLMLPGMDGIEIMRFLADHHWPYSLLLVSGYDASVLHSAQKIAKERKLNIVASFSKPLPVKNFQATLRSLLSNEPAQPDQHLSGLSVDPDEVRLALEQKQLCLHYQPQVLLKTGKLASIEALVRWQHPERGMIYPDSFLPLMQKWGLMGDLTEQVLQNVIKQISIWKAQGFEPKVSFNIAAESFTSVNLPEYLSRLVDTHKLNPALIGLEVTETTLMSELITSLDVLTRLRMKGFALSIDDFGMGYSSLSQLHRAPFNELKIDKSFVMHMVEDEEANAIVETCILLGHKLNMKVVAEGVMSSAIWEKLSAMGCDIAQGFFVAKPMPAESLLEWVKKKDLSKPVNISFPDQFSQN
ncbi:MAG TPA: EAL domain-containing response regulator [Pseudomonadales bacterium]